MNNPPIPIHYHNRYSEVSDSSYSDSVSSYSSGSTVPSTAPSSSGEDGKFVSAADYFASNFKQPRESFNTYRSTIESLEECPSYSRNCYQPRDEATPCDPQQFASLFPSRGPFIIKHDDSVPDAAMNLRIDAELSRAGRRSNRKATLFYLRMHELQSRKFTLRRYGRDCGREVANTHRKMACAERPKLQTTVSKAFQSFRGKPESEFGFKRQDSGYATGSDDDSDFSPIEKDAPKPTKTSTIEFSNYAHVDVSRKGSQGSKKYDFEYWGNDYAWKRVVSRDGIYDITNFELHNMTTNSLVAIIYPLDHDHISDEAKSEGKFVPPSCFQFKLPESHMRRPGFADLADVAMATGLTSLVDDCIKRSSCKTKTIQFVLPVPMKSPKKVNMEYIGAKRMIEEICKRSPTKPTFTRSPPARANTSPAKLLAMTQVIRA
jgi:hypothetical protein